LFNKHTILEDSTASVFRYRST